MSVTGFIVVLVDKSLYRWAHLPIATAFYFFISRCIVDSLRDNIVRAKTRIDWYDPYVDAQDSLLREVIGEFDSERPWLLDSVL